MTLTVRQLRSANWELQFEQINPISTFQVWTTDDAPGLAMVKLTISLGTTTSWRVQFKDGSKRTVDSMEQAVRLYNEAQDDRPARPPAGSVESIRERKTGKP